MIMELTEYTILYTHGDFELDEIVVKAVDEDEALKIFEDTIAVDVHTAFVDDYVGV